MVVMNSIKPRTTARSRKPKVGGPSARSASTSAITLSYRRRKRSASATGASRFSRTVPRSAGAAVRSIDRVNHPHLLLERVVHTDDHQSPEVQNGRLCRAGLDTL